MLAYVLEQDRAVLKLDRARPRPGEGMVGVRMVAAGVCGTDLELVKGYMGFSGVLGHEFVGEALDGPLAGRRVVGGINFACGNCRACAGGMDRHCPHRRVLGIKGADGVFAEEFLIPPANLLEVPAGVSDDEAVFVEPLAAAWEVVDQLGDCERVPALVVGDGKLGPLIAQALASEGFEVEIFGRHLETLEWIEGRGVRRRAAQPAAGAYRLVVEASGSAAGMAVAMASTSPRGTLVLKTTTAASSKLDLSPLVINEINVIGSRCGPVAPALDLLDGAKVEVEPLIDGRFPLADVEAAFERAARSGVRKILLEGV